MRSRERKRREKKRKEKMGVVESGTANRVVR
jgi:hypothetical protein